MLTASVFLVVILVVIVTQLQLCSYSCRYSYRYSYSNTVTAVALVVKFNQIVGQPSNDRRSSSIARCLGSHAQCGLPLQDDGICMAQVQKGCLVQDWEGCKE